MKKIALGLMLGIFFLIIGANVFAEELRVVTGGTTAVHVLNPLKEPFEKATGIKLNIVTLGGKIAVQELDKGNYELAGAAHSLEEIVELVKKDGSELKNLSMIQVHKISDPVNYAIIVNKNNPVSKLTKEQIKGIYTGKITNWKEVGGNDMPIIVLVPKLQPAGNRVLSNKILDKEAIMKDVLEVNIYSDVNSTVEANLETIGMTMAILVDGSVKAVETPEITTGDINFFTIGKPSPNVQRLIDFARGEGSKYIVK